VWTVAACVDNQWTTGAGGNFSLLKKVVLHRPGFLKNFTRLQSLSQPVSSCKLLQVAKFLIFSENLHYFSRALSALNTGEK
jgi:hypothetical protein